HGHAARGNLGRVGARAGTPLRRAQHRAQCYRRLRIHARAKRRRHARHVHLRRPAARMDVAGAAVAPEGRPAPLHRAAAEPETRSGERTMIGVTAAMFIALASSNPFPAATPESVGLDPAAVRELATRVRLWVDQEDAVGAELLIVKNRRTVLHAAYGAKD